MYHDIGSVTLKGAINAGLGNQIEVCAADDVDLSITALRQFGDDISAKEARSSRDQDAGTSRRRGAPSAVSYPMVGRFSTLTAGKPLLASTG